MPNNAELSFEHLPSVLLLFDRRSLELVEANAAARRLLGLQVVEPGTRFTSFIDRTGQDLLVRKIKALSSGAETVTGQVSLRSPDGKRPVAFTLRSMPDTSTLLLQGRDLSGSVSSYERLVHIFDGATDPIVVWNRSGAIVDANAALQSWTERSRDELREMHVTDLFTSGIPPTDTTSEQEIVTPTGNVPVQVRTRLINPDEQNLTAAFVTDLRPSLVRASLERSLIQAQRLESLGRLAAGIAHDFNNMLMAALPWADLIRRKYPEDEMLVRAADHIRRSVHRARDVTRQLLDFAQPRTPERASVDLSQMILQQRKLLTAASKDIAIVIEGHEGGPEAWIDPAQLAQALLNLGLFARDAASPGTNITLSLTESRSLPAEVRAQFASIEIRWRGEVLSDDQQASLFDPFSGIEEGKTGGLALSVARRIIEQNGGRILVSSIGAESTITVLVPRPEQERIAAPGGEIDVIDLQGLSVLLIDDDVDAAAGLVTLLEERGAKVHLTTTAGDGVLIARAVPIVAAIVDARLRDATVRELLPSLRSARPGIPVIVSSGSPPEDLDIPTDSDISFVQKPFELQELLRRFAAAGLVGSGQKTI